MSLDTRFDKRIFERKIKKGEISKQDYEHYLENLPDLQNEAEVIVIPNAPDFAHNQKLPKSSS